MIVVTDQLVLDQQLQDGIYQIDHAKDAVVKIDENSTQLSEALLGESAKVIITTLLKFPFILGKTSASKARKNAVIVDEAHSSQSGVAAMALRAALTKGQDAAAALIVAERQEQEEKAGCDGQDPIALALAGRGRQDNISFFPFSATPKAKTLELFGQKVEVDGETQRTLFLLSGEAQFN